MKTFLHRWARIWTRKVYTSIFSGGENVKMFVSNRLLELQYLYIHAYSAYFWLQLISICLTFQYYMKITIHKIITVGNIYNIQIEKAKQKALVIMVNLIQISIQTSIHFITVQNYQFNQKNFSSGCRKNSHLQLGLRNTSLSKS